MNRRGVFVGSLWALSFVIPFVANADLNGQIPLTFEGAGCFGADYSAYPTISYFGTDVVDVDGLGETSVDWTIDAQVTQTGLDFIQGDFVMQLPDGHFTGTGSAKWKTKEKHHGDRNTLSGEYTDFQVNPLTGDYTLDWSFLNGTGAFEDAHGTGRTNGFVNLQTLCAQFSFEGHVTLDD